MSDGHSHKRPWLAAALALVYPGLGHVYLREWLRSLLWFGLVLTTTSLVVPQSAVPESAAGFSFEAVMAASRALPTEATLALFVLSVLNTVDAYRLARERNRRADPSEGRCPHCGNETDPDLEFCQWCTEPLDGGPDASARSSANTE